MNTIIQSQHMRQIPYLFKDFEKEKHTQYKRVFKKLLPYGVLLALASCSQTVQARFISVNQQEKINPLITPIYIPKNYRFPNDNEQGIIRKERRNKQRIIDRNRDISPYKNYYQQ